MGGVISHIFLLFIACAVKTDGAPEVDFDAPDAPGPYLAGTERFELVGREGLTLPVQVWFPATGGTDTPYRYDDLLEGSVMEYTTPSCDAAHQAIVFSHGNNGTRYQNFSVMEFLATHGFVVAAPDHVDNTFLDLGKEELWPQLVMRRPLDVADTFDWLAAEAADSDSPLFGCIEPDAGYAVMGHSFGGFTTYAVAGAPLNMVYLQAACATTGDAGCAAVDQWFVENPGGTTLDRSDSRVWAAVPWEPAWHEFFSTMSAIVAPALVIGGDRDELTPWDTAVKPSYEALSTTPRYLARLENTGHYNMTDMCAILPSDFNGCQDDFRPYADVLKTSRTLTLAFLLTNMGIDEAANWLPPDEGINHFESVE